MRNTAIALALMLTAAVSAQTPPANQASPPEGAIVTATGCLRAGDQPGTLTLINIKWDPAEAASKNASAHHEAPPPAPAGPAGTATRAGQPTSVRLAGPLTRLKVKEEIGHTVTVTGMLVPDDPIVTPGVVLPEPTGDTTSREAEAARRNRPAGPRTHVLNLRSITRVSAECK
jgi:hypothetical protein